MERPQGLTVCVCTHNRPEYLAGCLEGLRRQTLPAPAIEVLVVDSASGPAAAARVGELVAQMPNARLLRLGLPGLSRARNHAAAEARWEYIAYIDDDAVPAPDWADAVLCAAAEGGPALIGGRILPEWEAPLPPWWPDRLRGVLSLIETEGQGEYRTPALPPGLEPCGANLIVHAPTLRALGGFLTSGRCGSTLLSDEEVQLAWRMQKAGFPIRYDSRIVVRHQVQAARLTPGWLMARLHWQGISTVVTRRLLGNPWQVWRELPRRLVVALLFAPAWLVPARSPALIALRWRFAYAAGFIQGAFGWGKAGLV